MSEVLDACSFGRSIPLKYRWDIWLDGKIHALTQGVDYTSTRGLISAVHRQAKLRGMVAHTSERYPGQVRIQVLPLVKPKPSVDELAQLKEELEFIKRTGHERKCSYTKGLCCTCFRVTHD